MMLDGLGDLNQLEGLLLAICAFFLMFCVYFLGRIGEFVQKFWLDYRKVNGLDERERGEDEYLG